MEQIICQEPGSFLLTNAERPPLSSGQAIVKIKRIGICGTDLHAYEGNQPFFSYPRVLGHELSGIIEDIGENENNLEKGDQVAVIPYLHCEECTACNNGKTNSCEKLKVMGVHQDGGMQEYLSVPVSHLIKANDLSLDEAAVLEPLAIGAHSVRRGDVKPGEKVLVIGAGPIGLGAMIFAKEKGADVIAMDVNEERLSFCTEWLGIENTVNALETPVEKLTELTNGAMADTVIDATGNKKSMESAFNYITHGGKLIYVGLVKQSIEFFDPDFHKRETTLMGSRNATLEDFDTVKRVLEKKEFSMTSYITHRSTFKEMTKEFPSWSKPESKVIKAMVELE